MGREEIFVLRPGKVRPGMGWDACPSHEVDDGRMQADVWLDWWLLQSYENDRSEYGMRGILRNMHAAAVITSFGVTLIAEAQHMYATWQEGEQI
jgi:hypothetical protein